MRIGVMGIAIRREEVIQQVNRIISENSSIVIGRMGLPVSESNVNMISLVIRGDTDRIGSMAGKIGLLRGVQIKSMLMKE